VNILIVENKYKGHILMFMKVNDNKGFNITQEIIVKPIIIILINNNQFIYLLQFHHILFIIYLYIYKI